MNTLIHYEVQNELLIPENNPPPGLSVTVARGGKVIYLKCVLFFSPLQVFVFAALWGYSSNSHSIPDLLFDLEMSHLISGNGLCFPFSESRGGLAI